MPPHLYFDPRLEGIRQAVSQAEKSGGDRMPAVRGAVLARGLITA
jgi:hypothetical protein